MGDVRRRLNQTCAVRRVTVGRLTRIAHVLCPIDLSEPSRHALEHAVAVTAWYEAQLTVLHVFSASLPLIPADALAAAPELADPIEPDKMLDEVRRFCVPSLSTLTRPAEFLVKDGNVPHEIVAEAKQFAVDLIVMGTHARKGIQRLLLGSVTERMLRTAHLPVLAVPPAERTAPITYERILCPIEFHESEPRALEYVLSMVLPFMKGVSPRSKKPGARLILLHVVENLFEQLPEYFSVHEREAMERLKRAVPADARDWCRPEPRVTAGRADTEILRVAAELGSDLIVMAVHGKGAINRRLYRSTTSRVVRGATCPVLTLCAE